MSSRQGERHAHDTERQRCGEIGNPVGFTFFEQHWGWPHCDHFQWTIFEKGESLVVGDSNPETRYPFELEGFVTAFLSIGSTGMKCKNCPFGISLLPDVIKASSNPIVPTEFSQIID